MALDVDEPRGDDEPARLDALLRTGVGERSARGDPDDAIPTNADVAVEPGIPGAIDDPAASDDDVVPAVIPAAARSGRGARREQSEEECYGRSDSHVR